MAKTTKTFLIDDLDGSEAAETMSFGLDGTTYEIELSATHAAELRSALDKFVERARRVAGARRPKVPHYGQRGPAVIDAEQRKAVRAWANENGYNVNHRGRIAAEVYEAWQKAHAE